jgi:hypothetical protein
VRGVSEADEGEVLRVVGRHGFSLLPLWGGWVLRQLYRIGWDASSKRFEVSASCPGVRPGGPGPGWEPSSERIGAGTNPFRLSHAPLAQSPPYSSPMGVS